MADLHIGRVCGSELDKRKWYAAARLHGQSFSAWANDVLTREAERVLIERMVIPAVESDAPDDPRVGVRYNVR